MFFSMRTFPFVPTKQIDDVNTKLWPGHCWCPRNFPSDATRQTSQFDVECDFRLGVWVSMCGSVDRTEWKFSLRNPNEYWVVSKVVTEIEFEIDLRTELLIPKGLKHEMPSHWWENLYSKHFPDCSCANSNRIIHTCLCVYSISFTNFQFDRIGPKECGSKRNIKVESDKKKSWFRVLQFMETSARILTLLHSQKLIRLVPFNVKSLKNTFWIELCYLRRCDDAIACDRNFVFCNNKKKKKLVLCWCLCHSAWPLIVNRPCFITHSEQRPDFVFAKNKTKIHWTTRLSLAAFQ